MRSSKYCKRKDQHGLLMASILGWVWSSASDPREDEVDPRTGMTPREVKLVQSDWRLVKRNLTAIGVDIFVALFEKHPHYQKLFADLADIPLAELRANKKMAAHGSTVMYSLTNVVDSLLDPEVDLELLRKVGRSHSARRLTRVHFVDVREMIVEVLGTNLRWKNAESVEAWTKALDFMYKGIYEGLDEEQ